MDRVEQGWDSFEDWLTNLSFVPQILVLMVTLVPLVILAVLFLNLLVINVFRVFDLLQRSLKSKVK